MKHTPKASWVFFVSRKRAAYTPKPPPPQLNPVHGVAEGTGLGKGEATGDGTGDGTGLGAGVAVGTGVGLGVGAKQYPIETSFMLSTAGKKTTFKVGS